MFGSMEATKELLFPDEAPDFKGLLPSYNKTTLRVTHLWEPLLVYGIHCSLSGLSQPLPKGGKWALHTRLFSEKRCFYFQPCLFPHLINLVASMGVYLFLFFLSSSATLFLAAMAVWPLTLAPWMFLPSVHLAMVITKESRDQQKVSTEKRSDFEPRPKPG